MSEKLPSGEVRITSPFLKKLDNYWYHYKWHTVAALVLVVAILVCTVQMCRKDPYDLEVVYGGPYDLLTNKQTRLDVTDGFSAIIDDENGDGERLVNFYSYWVDDSLFAEDADKSGNIGLLVNNSMNNKEALRDELLAGDVMIFLLSPSMFWEYAERDAFVPITEIYPEIEPYKSDICPKDEVGRLSAQGILLSATSLGQTAGFSRLPADTVLCMRKVAPLQSLPFRRKRAEAERAYCTEYMRRILENELTDMDS